MSTSVLMDEEAKGFRLATASPCNFVINTSSINPSFLFASALPNTHIHSLIVEL